MKKRLRSICSFSYSELKANIDILLRPNGIPIEKVQNFARFCYRFMDGYRKGLSGPILDYTLRKCKSHRTIPQSIIDEVQGDGGKSFREYLKKRGSRRIHKAT